LFYFDIVVPNFEILISTENRALILFLAFLAVSLSAVAQPRTLDFYLQSGKANNPLLKDYAGRIKSNNIDSQLIVSGNKPQVNLNSQLSVAPVIKGYGYDSAASNGGTYSALVGVSKPLLRGKVLANQYESINIQNKGISNSAKVTEHDLNRSITAQYLTAYADYNQYIFTKSDYDFLKKEERLLRQLVNEGIYKQSSYISFLLEMQNEEVAIKQLLIQYRSDLASLNLICGMADTSFHTLAAPDIKSHPREYPGLSPLLLQYQFDSLMLVNNKKAIDLKYRPRLDAFADAGLNATSPEGIYKRFGTSIGISLIMPIYDGGQRKLDYQKLKIAESTRSNYEAYYKLQYKQQVDMLNQQLEATGKLVVDLKSQVSYSEKLLDMIKLQLDKGDISITDLVLAVRNDLTIRNNLNLNQVKQMMIINELNYWNW
jgi:outer membrane protein TolC